MTWLLWYLLLALLLAMMARGFWDARARLEFPFLAAVAALYHVLFPLYALLRQQGEAPVLGLDRTMVMTLLCLAASWAGYQYRWQTTLFQGWKFDNNRLAVGAAVLALGGAVAGFGVGQINVQTTEEGQMTGLATVLLFLSTAARFGFVIAALLYIRTRKKWLWLLMLPQIWIYLSQLNYARRSPMGELAVSVLLFLFFARRWTPPLWLLGLGALAGAFYHFNVATLRSTIGQPMGERIQVLLASNPFDAFKKSGLEEKEGFSVELNNAAFYIEATTDSGYYTYGRHFWNQLVFGWVPAQFVGRGFKESLKFDLRDPAAESGFEKPLGTCESGIAEAYMSFWFFGALLFFLLGAWLRFLWDGALQGSLIHQTLLALCTFGACMTFSGQLWSYINVVSQVLVFTVPFFSWSRQRSVSGRNNRRRGAPDAARQPVKPATS